MRTSDTPPDPMVVPAAKPVPLPLDRGLRVLTTSANHGLLWIGLAGVGWLVGGRPRRAALRAMASLGAASFLSNTVIKPLVGRRRPDAERTHAARRIGRVPWTSSFPSGHSASAFAVATATALELPAAGVALAPVAAAVAYSRVHVGVHYPSDVIVGGMIGVGVALAGQGLWPAKPQQPADAAPGRAPALPGGRGLTVVINEASGTSDDANEAIAAALPAAKIVTWDPEGDLAEQVGEGHTALGVAGGDGTVATVADLAHRTGVPLAVFPFGTLNHFAGALGLADHADTAGAVESGSAVEVDLALINGEPFLNTAGIGGYPEMVVLRDKLSHRMGKWPAAAYALFRTLRHHTPISLVIDGKTMPVWVVFVGNGVYTPRGLAPAWREHLADGLVDLQYLRADRKLSRTVAVIASLVGLVERTGVLGSVKASRIVVESEEPLPVAHDGEVIEPVQRVVLELAATRLTVYRPQA